MKIGTYKQCTDCKLKRNCCNSFEKGIDNVLINHDEVIRIKNEVGFKNVSDYFVPRDDELYNIKIDEEGACVFYKNGKCTIYDYRSADCRLYPFDIMKKEGEYFLILYKNECIDKDTFIEESKNIDGLIKSIVPWIDKYADRKNFPELYEKIDNDEYIVVKKININI